MPSFGHAAWFGLGAYGAALAAHWLARRCGSALALRRCCAGTVAAAVRLVRGAAVGRLSRHADAGLRADRLGGRVPVGRRSPAATTAYSASGRPPGLRTPAAFYWLALAPVRRPATLLLRAHALCAVRLRAARRARLARRAEAIGLDVRRAPHGGLRDSPAPRRGSPGPCSPMPRAACFPTYVGIGALGGRAADGAARRRRRPWPGRSSARSPTPGSTTGCCSHTTMWRLVLGLTIVLLVLAFPEGIAGCRAARSGGAAARHEPARRPELAEILRRRAGGRRRVLRRCTRARCWR